MESKKSTRSVKILYICHGFSWGGGVEQYILNVLKEINRKEYEISILFPEHKTPYQREKNLKDLNIRIITYDCSLYRNKCKSLYTILKTEHFDIVHCYTDMFTALIAIIAKLAGIKTVIAHSHTSMIPIGETSKTKLVLKKLLTPLSYLIYKTMTHRAACSKTAARFMFGTDNITILNNGIDLSTFDFHKLNLENNRDPNKLCINARFSPQKNPWFVLKVVDELRKFNSNIVLTWIGSGELEKDIRKKAGELELEGNVVFVGTTDKVGEILMKNSYFLLPSIREGLPITLIEAQAAGLTCFISDSITQEADIGSCVALSLDKGAEEWARTIHDEIKSNSSGVYYPKDNTENLKKFDLKYTVKELENFYSICVQ